MSMTHSARQNRQKKSQSNLRLSTCFFLIFWRRISHLFKAVIISSFMVQQYTLYSLPFCVCMFSSVVICSFWILLFPKLKTRQVNCLESFWWLLYLRQKNSCYHQAICKIQVRIFVAGYCLKSTLISSISSKISDLKITFLCPHHLWIWFPHIRHGARNVY